jgi:hypothetical protein
MDERISFNINAELYESNFGELAIRFAGDYVYRGVGREEGAQFHTDAVRMLESGEHPEGWRAMTPRELLYGQWHCISRLGYVQGDAQRPGLELEVAPDELGATARSYLAAALH